MVGAPRQQVGDDPVDVRARGSSAHRHQQRQRQSGHMPGDGMHRAQRQRIRPLQILNGQRQRGTRRQLLHHVQDVFDDDPALVGETGRRCQPPHLVHPGPAHAGRVGRGWTSRWPLDVQGVTQRQQRTVPFELVARPHQHPKPDAARRTPASRRSDGTCRSPLRPRPPPSGPGPSPHPQARRATSSISADRPTNGTRDPTPAIPPPSCARRPPADNAATPRIYIGHLTDVSAAPTIHPWGGVSTTHRPRRSTGGSG